jgi:hypothetical protein
MGKIYVGQTELRMHYDCNVDLTGYSAIVINVTLPDGTTTTWTPTIDTVAEGTMYYDIANDTILAQEGKYLQQPQATMGSGDIVPGETKSDYVYGRYK